jgi:predicted nucleotidyltransferase
VSASLAPLLSPQEIRAVEAFVNLLHERHPFRILQTVLFGSKARGDSQPWSDIDILIIVDTEDWRFQHAISTLGARVSLEYDVLIGPRVIGQKRWEGLRDKGFSFYRNIEAEGIPLDPSLPSSRATVRTR